MKRYRKLSAEEEAIIQHKHTEPAGSGEFEDFEEPGIFVCKRCDAPLYLSKDKFSSGCGWPSFDEEVLGAVEKRRDADGERIEILCKRCGSHLGHVFVGEKFTPKDTRHCVNSLSLLFIPAFTKEGFERAVFAGGKTLEGESRFSKEPGVLKVTRGYTGGELIDPKPYEVEGQNSGHLPALELIFDPSITDFKLLAKRFLEFKTPDVQVFFLTEKQRRIAEDLGLRAFPAGPFYLV